MSSEDTLVMFERATGGVAEDSGDLRFREAAAADGDAYARWIATDTATSFAGRLSGSTRCFVVEHDRRFVHASWVTTGPAWTRELRRYLVSPDGGAYVYESFTRDEVRGRGIYPLALRNIAACMALEGIARLYVAVEKDNAPSLRAVAKAGFEPAFELPYRRRFGAVRIGSASGPRANLASSFVSVSPDASTL